MYFKLLIKTYKCTFGAQFFDERPSFCSSSSPLKRVLHHLSYTSHSYYILFMHLYRYVLWSLTLFSQTFMQIFLASPNLTTYFISFNTFSTETLFLPSDFTGFIIFQLNEPVTKTSTEAGLETRNCW